MHNRILRYVDYTTVLVVVDKLSTCAPAATVPFDRSQLIAPPPQCHGNVDRCGAATPQEKVAPAIVVAFIYFKFPRPKTLNTLPVGYTHLLL
jgi:hypothetical protein